MNFSKLMARKGKGFTLVEILVVILIIGLLFVFLVPKISSATDKARETGIKTDMHSYEIAFESVVKENSGLGQTAVGTGTNDLENKVNGYLDPALKITSGVAAKKDPWNNAYKVVYVSPASTNNGAIMVYSMGKDGQQETAYAAPTVASTSTDFVDFAAATGKNADNYALVTEYVAGTQYTATTGFSKNIAAK